MDPVQHNPNLPKKKSYCLSLSPISHLPFYQLVLLSCPLFQRSPHPRLLVMSIAHLLVDITTKNLSLRLLVRICLRTIPHPTIIPLLHLDTITTLISLALRLVNSLVSLTLTGDKGPNTHWVHGENIEITVNMWLQCAQWSNAEYILNILCYVTQICPVGTYWVHFECAQSSDSNVPSG